MIIIIGVVVTMEVMNRERERTELRNERCTKLYIILLLLFYGFRQTGRLFAEFYIHVLYIIRDRRIVSYRTPDTRSKENRNTVGGGERLMTSYGRNSVGRGVFGINICSCLIMIYLGTWFFLFFRKGGINEIQMKCT